MFVLDRYYLEHFGVTHAIKIKKKPNKIKKLSVSLKRDFGLSLWSNVLRDCPIINR